jgi:hypothetical protein
VSQYEADFNKKYPNDSYGSSSGGFNQNNMFNQFFTNANNNPNVGNFNFNPNTNNFTNTNANAGSNPDPAGAAGGSADANADHAENVQCKNQ